MRKFIAVGLTSLSAVTFVIGATPALAGPVVDQACLDLGPAVTASTNAVTLATVSNNAAEANVTAKRLILDTAINEWVAALANHLEEQDKFNGNPAATQLIVNAELQDVSVALEPWGNAKIAAFFTRHNLDQAEIGLLINSGLSGQLGC